MHLHGALYDYGIQVCVRKYKSEKVIYLAREQ